MARPKGIQQRKRLTPKQKKLVKAVVLDPHQTLDELGESSGYNNRSAVHRALQAPAVKDALNHVRDLMAQREKLSLGALLTKLEEGLEAKDIRSLKVDGTKLRVATEVEDQTTRHKFLVTALELHGAIKQKADAAPSGPVNIAIILAGGGSEAEKNAVADTLIAARLARGLHPTENRLLTEQEIESYRRTP
jgi:hypothetical protein